MSPMSEIGLTCLRELKRNLRSAKGVVMAVLFLLGGGAASLVYAAVSQLAGAKDVPAEALRADREELWRRVFDNADIGRYLSDSPLFFVALFKALWWLIPFLTLLIGFDQLCADRQHRTIRFDVIRARRSSLVVGKALSLWIVVSVLVLALQLFTWIVSLALGGSDVWTTLSWGGRFWLLCVVCIGTWSGLTVLMSSWTRRPILALFVGLAAFSGLALGDLVTYAIASAATVKPDWWVSKFAPARFAFPGFYQQWLVTPHAPQMLGAIALLLAVGAAATAGAAWVLNRSDV